MSSPRIVGHLTKTRLDESCFGERLAFEKLWLALRRL